MKKTRKISKKQTSASDEWIFFFIKNGYSYLTALHYSTKMKKMGYSQSLSDDEKKKIFLKWMRDRRKM